MPKKINKKKILETFDEVISSTILSLNEDELELLADKKNESVYGSYLIKYKNDKWIIVNSDTARKENISFNLYSTAYCYAMCMEKNLINGKRKVLNWESSYTKHLNDIVHYSYSKRFANLEDTCMYDDRISVAKHNIVKLKRAIRSFRLSNK